MNVIIYNIETQEQKRGKYPNKDISIPVVGLDSNIRFYITVDEEKPSYNPDTQSLTYNTEFTETPHPDYPHILINKGFWTVNDLPQEDVIERLSNSVGNWIEEKYPLWKQTKYLSRYIYLQQLEAAGVITTSQTNEKTFLEDLDTWANQCRASRDQKEQEFLDNGIAPDFTWSEPPLKENYNI